MKPMTRSGAVGGWVNQYETVGPGAQGWCFDGRTSRPPSPRVIVQAIDRLWTAITGPTAMAIFAALILNWRFVDRRRWITGGPGEIGELFVKRDQFDLCACPRCERVQFFVDGVGEEHRPQ